MNFVDFECTYYPVSFESLKKYYHSDTKAFLSFFEKEYSSYANARINVETKEEALEMLKGHLE